MATVSHFGASALAAVAAVAKGKGRGKQGGGKGGPKGAPGKGAGSGPGVPAIPRNYKEGCWHCGDPGHRRQECPKYQAELKRLRAAAGGGVHELGSEPTESVAMEAAWYLGQLAGTDEAEPEAEKKVGALMIN